MLRLIIGGLGVVIVLWSLGAGFLTRRSNKAEVFSGNVGCLVNGVVLIIGGAMIWWAVAHG